MPQVDNANDRGLIMEVMERISSKLDDTRDKVIEQGTKQESDRRLHDERHAENKKRWDDHTKSHENIMDELESVKDSIILKVEHAAPPPVPAQGIDKNLLMKLVAAGFFLLMGLIYALTGNDLPTIPGITE